MRSDRIFGVIWLFVAIAMGILASQFVAPFSYEPIGPSKYPILLAVLNALCAVWLIARPGPEAQWPDRALWRKIFLMFATLLGYAFLFEPLGFMLATALLTVALGMLYGGTWKKCAIGGAAMGPGLYLLFDRLLDVTLPVGAVFASP
jgi:putative tricarboxylic transport membrane protein